MSYKNFRVETDADGIALVTWDIPDRSMNVLDETSTNELDAIVKQTTADAAVKGVVITSAKDAFCAGADLSMLEGMNQAYAKVFKEQGETAANQMLFDQSRQASRGRPRSTASRSAVVSRSRCAATTASPRRIPRPGLACPRSRSAYSPVPAVRSVCRAWCRRRTP
jgi:3-hydroxyacyl-CoA dehydrogenase/enoyl-CoA hydratase/3-hydroxybutyryl-CoA epimerase